MDVLYKTQRTLRVVDYTDCQKLDWSILHCHCSNIEGVNKGHSKPEGESPDQTGMKYTETPDSLLSNIYINYKGRKGAGEIFDLPKQARRIIHGQTRPKRESDKADPDNSSVGKQA